LFSLNEKVDFRKEKILYAKVTKLHNKNESSTYEIVKKGKGVNAYLLLNFRLKKLCPHYVTTS
jgi:hypothetical protein